MSTKTFLIYIFCFYVDNKIYMIVCMLRRYVLTILGVHKKYNTVIIARFFTNRNILVFRMNKTKIDCVLRMFFFRIIFAARDCMSGENNTVWYNRRNKRIMVSQMYRTPFQDFRCDGAIYRIHLTV